MSEQKVYTNPIMEFFNPDRFADKTSQAVAGHFRYLAETLDKELPNSAEKSAGLRKLLESLDCMVRAVVPPSDDLDEGSLKRMTDALDSINFTAK